jgi:glycine cleavage system H protein
MDAFSYTDIFDTKGLEYLIVIGFLLLIVPIWLLLNKPVKTRIDLVRSIRGLSEELLKIPQGVYFNQNQTWAFLERNGLAKIGISDMMLHITGGVSVDYLKKEGETIEKGEKFARVIQDDHELLISSPVSGRIGRVNHAIELEEGKINLDPYGEGWLLQVKPKKWKNDIVDSKLDEEAVIWTKEELLRFKDFLSGVAYQSETGEALPVLQEGGELVDYPLSEMGDDAWRKFQKEFLG